MTPLGRVVYPILQCTLRMRESLCTAAELHLLADIVPSLLAAIAALAWLTDFESNLIAYGETLNVGTNAHNNTSGFMTE